MLRYAICGTRLGHSGIQRRSAEIPFQTFLRGKSSLEDPAFDDNGFDETQRNRSRRFWDDRAQDRRTIAPSNGRILQDRAEFKKRPPAGNFIPGKPASLSHLDQLQHGHNRSQEGEGRWNQNDLPNPKWQQNAGRQLPMSVWRNNAVNQNDSPRPAIRQDTGNDRQLPGPGWQQHAGNQNELPIPAWRRNSGYQNEIPMSAWRQNAENQNDIPRPGQWQNSGNQNEMPRPGRQQNMGYEQRSFRSPTSTASSTNHQTLKYSVHQARDNEALRSRKFIDVRQNRQNEQKQSDCDSLTNMSMTVMSSGTPPSTEDASWRLKLNQLRQTARDAGTERSLSHNASKLVPRPVPVTSQVISAESEQLNSSWKHQLETIRGRQGIQGITTIDALISSFQHGSTASPMISNSSKETSSHKSMTDISSLRDAFIKGQEAEKIRKRQQAEEFRAAGAIVDQEEGSSTQTPTLAWRAPNGAREFREKLIAEKEAEEQAQLQVATREPDIGAVKLQQRVMDSIHNKKGEEMKRRRQQGLTNGKEAYEVILPPNDLSVHDLSKKLRVSQDMIMSILRQLGENPKDWNSMVDIDTMELLALELGLNSVRSRRRVVKSISEEDRETLLRRRACGESVDEGLLAKYEALPQRPPVVCLMGHVDHGKTTLMDALRRRSNSSELRQTMKGKTKKAKTANKNANSDDVAGTEAGGITQAISAFQVTLADQGTAVTFLDTPGHAAFRAMRESGSHAADVIVLVIAADDGVSRQTVEIIEFFKSIVTGTGGGGISLVIAMTKIDKPGVNVAESQRRIENQLLEHGILTETFGGRGDFGPPAQLLPVSGITGEGLDQLIEGLALQSEIMDLRADPDAHAEGIIMDARTDKSLGVVADCIIRWGSLQRGDIVVSGTHIGKIKALKDPTNTVIKMGGPSQPVRIIGFKTTPKAGDPLVVVESEEKAQMLVARREALQIIDPDHVEERPDVDTKGAIEVQISGVSAQRPHMLARLFGKHGIDVHTETTQVRIPVVLKADADGTLAALKDSIIAIGVESKLDVVIDPIVAGIGQVTHADVIAASAAGAAIFSFNLKNNDTKIMSLIEEKKVKFKNDNVIYSLIDDAKEIFSDFLPEKTVYHIHGKATVQAVFEINNKSDAERIAGLMVNEGTLYTKMTKHPSGVGTIECYYRVIRAGEVISAKGDTVKCSSLRRVKEVVDSIRFGQECGLGLTGFDEFDVGDTIECYSVEMKRETI